MPHTPMLAHGPSAVFPAPPPTSNTLSSANRAALVRTTRKITAVLGSTPHLLDSLSPASAAPSTTKTPMNILPVGPSSLRIQNQSSASSSTSSLGTSNSAQQAVGDAERRARRRQRRQCSIFELPPWQASASNIENIENVKPIPRPLPKPRSATLRAVPTLSPMSGLSHLATLSPLSTTGMGPVNGNGNHNGIRMLPVPPLIADIASSDSERDSPVTPTTPTSTLRTRGRSFADKTRQRSRSRGRGTNNNNGNHNGNGKGRKQRPPPLVLALDIPVVSQDVQASSVQQGSYFSPDSAPSHVIHMPSASALSGPSSRRPSAASIATITSTTSSDMTMDMDVDTEPISFMPLSPLSPSSVINTPRTASCNTNYNTNGGSDKKQKATADARRRKMAKLQRTLGEPVPVELVFGGRARGDGANALGVSISGSIGSSPKRTPTVKAKMNPFGTSSSSEPYILSLGTRRSRSASRSPVRKQASNPVVPPGLGMGMQVNVEVAVSIDVTQPSFDTHPMPILSTRRFGASSPSRSPESVPRSPAPFTSLAARRRSRSFAAALHTDAFSFSRLREGPERTVARTPVIQQAPQGVHVEEGKGWIGQWNRGDMETVRRGLRALR